MTPDKLVINTDNVQMTEAARKAGVESIFEDISDAMGIAAIKYVVCPKCKHKTLLDYSKSMDARQPCDNCGYLTMMRKENIVIE